MAAHTLLVLEAAFQRIGEQIHAQAPDLCILSMDDAGNFALDGSPVEQADIAPTIAWMGLDLFTCKSASTFTEAVLQSPGLQWAQTALAGVDAPMFKQIIDNGTRLSSSDAQAASVADFVVGSVIAHLQRYVHRHELQAARKWQPYPFREVGRTRWLIVGYGSIGQEVAKRVQGFGASIVGVRRQPHDDPWARVTTPEHLPVELPNADIVVLACALTDATRGMVDANFLGQMQPQSILVNVGRGALVVDADLLHALDDGHIEHAVLDVFDPEPLPETDPYWQHPSVLVTSHGSSFGDGMAERGDALFLGNLRRFLAGEALHKEVHAIP